MKAARDIRAAAIDAQFVPRHRSHTYTVEIDGDAIVLDEDQNRLHLLNATGAIVWACCDGSGTVGVIASDLAGAADMPIDRVTADVLAMVRTLGAEGLLEGVAPDPGDTGVEVPDVDVSAPLADG